MNLLFFESAILSSFLPLFLGTLLARRKNGDVCIQAATPIESCRREHQPCGGPCQRPDCCKLQYRPAVAALLAIMAQCNIPMTKAQATEIMQLLEPDEQGRSGSAGLWIPQCGPVKLSPLLTWLCFRILYRDFLAIFHVQMPRLDGDIVRPFTGIHAASAGLPGTRRQTPQFT
jgi:hypothetical protein